MAVPLLFSYGTLRDPAVQRANFGRELVGREDRLPRYEVDDYRRVSVVLASGAAAWVYVSVASAVSIVDQG
jgi:hypothetical protein